MSDGKASPVLVAERVSRSLPGDPPVTLVSDADLAIEPGKFTAIVGPSGCGKSSLLYLLGLIDRPTQGRLLLEGRDVTPLDNDARAQIRLERFGFVFQFHFLLPEFTALENVMLPIRRLARLSVDEARRHAAELLGFMGLADKVAKMPEQLSGGERQRVAIARALAVDPDILLMDEPLSALDRPRRQEIIELILKIHALKKIPIIFVTHDTYEAEQLADERVFMDAGRVFYP